MFAGRKESTWPNDKPVPTVFANKSYKVLRKLGLMKRNDLSSLSSYHSFASSHIAQRGLDQPPKGLDRKSMETLPVITLSRSHVDLHRVRYLTSDRPESLESF